MRRFVILILVVLSVVACRVLYSPNKGHDYHLTYEESGLVTSSK